MPSAAQRPLRGRPRRPTVGYFGAPGTFSNEVAAARFGRRARLVPYPFMLDLRDDLAADRIDAAVIPIENSVGGWVVDILDLILSAEFRRSRLRVVEELRHRIELSLVGHATLATAERLYGHRYPLRVAREWLHRARPDLALVEVHNTAEAAERASADRHAVALAHRRAAELRGLPIQLERVETPQNATRFFVVAKHRLGPARATKTALCLEIADRPGALHDVLGVLRREGLNLCRLHSHAQDAALEAYTFFVEIEAPARAPAMRRALAALARKTRRLEVVGSFPMVEQ